MATTTNFGWTTPDDTGLVKNGASAIRSLGSAIDSSLGGAWTTYTPTFTNFTTGNGTITAKYKAINKIIIGSIQVTLGSTSVMGTNPRFTLPVTSVTYKVGSVGAIYLEDSGSADFFGALAWYSTTETQIKLLNASGTYLTFAGPTATVPFTWTTNDGFAGHFWYEAA